MESSQPESSFHVFGIGQCCLDAIGRIQDYPLPDTKCQLSDLVVQGGGPASTALVALSRWGLSCAFAGISGDDPFAERIKASLDEEGIDTSGLIVRHHSDSQFAFIAAEPGLGRRTVFWRRPTGQPLQPEEINYRLLENARVLHTDGNFGEAAMMACKRARQAGVQVVIDADSFYESMVDLARFSDHFIASQNFASKFLGKDDPKEACDKIAELGPRVVAVTLGPNGYVALAEGKYIEKPAYRVEAIDTTGCGDIFHAGYIFGLIQGWDFEKKFDFAAWAAAMVSLKLGGRSGIPSIQQIQEKGYI